MDNKNPFSLGTNTGLFSNEQVETIGTKTDLKKAKYQIRLNKNRIKYADKIKLDVENIKGIIADMEPGHNTMLFSNEFDSPNILQHFINEGYKIKTVLVGTWAITNGGIGALQDLVNAHPAVNVSVVMDKLHSSKWVFASGAIDILHKRVEFIFVDNHAKFICIETEAGCYSFIGSMNLSNNPRWENVMIERSEDREGMFNFCNKFVNEAKQSK